MVAAVFLQPLGAVRKAATVGAVGAAGGAAARAVLAARSADADPDGTTGIAAGLPDGPTVIAVTPGRVLFFAFSQLRSRPADLLVELPRDQLVGVAVEKGKLAHGATLTFSDGSAREFDLPRAQKFEEFATQFV